jgi:hypothetical protein
MCPDLNLHPTLIDADNPSGLAWVYEGNPAARPPAIDLDDLPVEVDWSRKRMIWVVYGSCHLGTLENMLTRITECAKIIVLEAQAPDAYDLLPAERERLLAWVESQKLTVIVGGSLEQRAEKLLQLIDINQFDGWKPILSKELMNLRPEATLKLFEQLGAGINVKIMSKGTYLTVAQHYLRNTLINAPLVMRGDVLARWKDMRKDRPVLLVSAGPSLNKQLPLLAQNQDLFTILAVNTVWPILQQHGIVPDVLLALDRNSRPAWPSNSVSHDTAFCVDLGCAPRLMWSHDHNHAITTCDPGTAGIAAALGATTEYLRTGGSVATSAFALAEVLGANPIIFIGQDLALTDGKDHAEGYPHTYSAQTLKMRTEKGFDVAGYHGGRVRTERQLMYYKIWLERRAKELPEKLIINATEGGARIEGAIQLPFAAVCNEVRATSLRKTPVMAAEKSNIDPVHMSTLRRNLVKMTQDIQEFRNHATQGRALCQRMGNRPSQKQLKRLDRLNQRIRQEDPVSKTIVNVMGLRKFEAIRYKTHIREGMDGIRDAIDKYDEVYQNIEIGADAALKMLEDMDRFYARVAERGDIALDLLDEIDPA